METNSSNGLSSVMLRHGLTPGELIRSLDVVCRVIRDGERGEETYPAAEIGCIPIRYVTGPFAGDVGVVNPKSGFVRVARGSDGSFVDLSPVKPIVQPVPVTAFGEPGWKGLVNISLMGHTDISCVVAEFLEAGRLRVRRGDHYVVYGPCALYKVVEISEDDIPF